MMSNETSNINVGQQFCHLKSSAFEQVISNTDDEVGSNNNVAKRGQQDRWVRGACLVVLLVVLGLTQLRLHPHAGLHRLLPTLLQQVYLRLRRVPLLRQLRLCSHNDDNDMMT